MVLSKGLTIALLVGVAACSSPSAPRSMESDSTDDHSSVRENRNAHENLSVGERAPLRVYAHCGFEFTEIDGELWKTRLRDDGQGNPPAGWTALVEGTIERTSDARAVFVGTSVRVRAVFRPAPNAKYSCM